MLARVLAFLIFISPIQAVAGDVELLMFEEDGCYWCGIWNAQISGIYPKTQEGRTAPLHRIDIHSAVPKDIKLKSRPFYTPTFVLVKNGSEIGRIEGYPGEDFFWGLLEQMLKPLPEYKTTKDSS